MLQSQAYQQGLMPEYSNRSLSIHEFQSQAQDSRLTQQDNPLKKQISNNNKTTKQQQPTTNNN